MRALKIFLTILIVSFLIPLNATSKKEKKKILSLFQTDEPVVSSKKPTAKLIKLFDDIPDESLPKYQDKTKEVKLPKYYSKIPPKEIVKDDNATKKVKNISLLRASQWKKEEPKFIEFDEDTQNDKSSEKINSRIVEKANFAIEDEDPNADKMKEIKFDKDSNYYDKVTKMVKNAFSLIGSAYKFGSQNRDTTYDCSLFTQRTFAKIGLKLPRSSIEQSQLGKRISKENLIVGDLLFFTTYRKTVSHVGIYIGDNKMIHASTQKGVTVDDLDDSYYRKRYLFAKRPNFAYEDYAKK